MKDITGQKFGRLTAVRFSLRKKNNYYWEFLCECEKKKTIERGSVVHNRIRSCGCLLKESSRERCKKLFTKHKMYDSRFYSIFYGIKTRCNNPLERNYKNYGGRGIKLLWNSFEQFKDDMYRSYFEHTKEFGEKNTQIDRIDVNGNYCKENCRWVSLKEQARNKRNNRIFFFRNKKRCLVELSEEFNIKRTTLGDRIAKGQSLETALITKGYKMTEEHKRRIGLANSISYRKQSFVK